MPKMYNRLLEPSKKMGNQAATATVHLSTLIVSIRNIDPLTTHFTANFLLWLTWNDPRLSFFDLHENRELNKIGMDSIQEIWTPSKYVLL